MSSASENSVKMEKTAEGLCCSCSKNSLCKTNKCRCRSSGGSCGASCGCKRFKCTNREPNQLEGNEPLKSDNTECTLEASAEDKDGSVWLLLNVLNYSRVHLFRNLLVARTTRCPKRSHYVTFRTQWYSTLHLVPNLVTSLRFSYFMFSI